MEAGAVAIVLFAEIVSLERLSFEVVAAAPV